MNQNSKKMADAIARVLLEHKGTDLLLLDIEERSVVADGFLLVSGRSTTQVRTLADALDDKLAAQGLECRHTEGYAASRWIIKDYGDILVHIFHKEDREFFNLERLWADGTNEYRYEETEEAASSLS